MCALPFAAQATLHAVDLECPVGTPVLAVGAGKVLSLQDTNTCVQPPAAFPPVNLLLHITVVRVHVLNQLIQCPQSQCPVSAAALQSVSSCQLLLPCCCVCSRRFLCLACSVCAHICCVFTVLGVCRFLVQVHGHSRQKSIRLELYHATP